MARVINRRRSLSHSDLLRLRRAIDRQGRARHVALDRELARRLVAAYAMLAMAAAGSGLNRSQPCTTVPPSIDIPLKGWLRRSCCKQASPVCVTTHITQSTTIRNSTLRNTPQQQQQHAVPTSPAAPP